MNTGFVMVSILVESNLSDKFLINALYNIDRGVLRNYLGLAEIYDGNSGKSKADLIEVILYGHTKNKLKKQLVNDISLNSAYKILRDKGISVLSLPGNGIMNLKRKDTLIKYSKN